MRRALCWRRPDPMLVLQLMRGRPLLVSALLVRRMEEKPRALPLRLQLLAPVVAPLTAPPLHAPPPVALPWRRARPRGGGRWRRSRARRPAADPAPWTLRASARAGRDAAAPR